MKIKSLISETPDYLRLVFGVLGFSVCYFLALPESIDGQQISSAGIFFNIVGFFLVFGQVMPAFWLRFRADVPVHKTVLFTAIPAGITPLAVGFQAITSKQLPLENLSAGASVMTLPILYGGFLAMIAYALRDRSDYKIPAVNLVTVLPCTFCIIGVVLFAVSSEISRGMTLSDYVSPKVFLLFVGIIVLFMARGGLNNFARILAESSIVGILVCIVLALIIWFRGITAGTIPNQSTDIATLGLLYGTFLFMMSYYVSLLTGETNEINFDIKNWHLIESAALYILLVFAPPSIFEIAA